MICVPPGPPLIFSSASARPETGAFYCSGRETDIKNPRPYTKGRESKCSRVTTFIHGILAHAASAGIITIPCTITGAPVSSYPRRNALQREAQGGIHECLSPRLSSAGCFLWVPSSLYLFPSTPFHIQYLNGKPAACQPRMYRSGRTFRKKEIQLPPMNFSASSLDIPRCRSAAVSSGARL